MGEKKKKKRLAEAAADGALALSPAEPGGDGESGAAAEAETEAVAHPEEIRASLRLRIGRTIDVTAAARATPAGLVAGAIAITAIMVPLIWIGRRR